MGFENGPRLGNSRRPDRYLESPTANREAVKEIERFLESYESYTPVEKLVELRNKCVAEGAITEAAANALPALKEAAERSFAKLLRQDSVHHAGFNTDEYVEVRDKWVAAGMLTAEAANHFPRVREIAEDDLFNAASAVNALDDTVRLLKERWINAGVLTEKEADRLITEGKAQREQYLRSPGGA